MEYKIWTFYRYRIEVLFFYLIFFSFFLIIDFLFVSNRENLDLSVINYHISIIFLISAIFSLILEFFYFFLKLFSLFILRLKNFWKYLFPSILIFNLIIFPLYDLTSLNEIFHNLEGLQNSIFLAITGFILLSSLILILVLPFFHGTNGGFIILSSFLSYFFYKYFLVKFFDYQFHIFDFFLCYYSLTGYLYLFFQVRRRYAINVLFENYYYDSKYFIVILIFLLTLLFIRFYIVINIIWIFFINLLIIFNLLISFLMFLINRETRMKRRFVNYPILFLLIIIFIIFLSLFNSIQKLNFDLLIHGKNQNFITMYFFNYIADIFDNDRDGESKYFGHDPDDTNPYIRSEGNFVSDLRNDESELKVNKQKNFFFFTLYFPDVYNKLENKEFYLSPSRKIEENLYSLIYYLSSYEIHYYNKYNPQILKEKKSIFTYLSENYYRTICIGFDNQKNYFELKSSLRLDKGCEIWLRYTEDKSFRGFLNNFLESYYKYKSLKNFIWGHFEFSENNISINEIVEKLIHLPLNYNLSPLYDVVIFLFYDLPFPHYYVVSTISNSKFIFSNHFSYYGSLYRFVFFDDTINDIDTNLNFLAINEQFYSENITIKNYVFIEPNDVARSYIQKFRSDKRITLPPISLFLDKNKVLLYDGRWGIKKEFNYKSSTDFKSE